MLFTIGSFVLAFRCWFNDNLHERCYYLIVDVAALTAIGLFPSASFGWYIVIDHNLLRWYYLGPAIAVLSTVGLCLPSFWRWRNIIDCGKKFFHHEIDTLSKANCIWYWMNDDNYQSWYNSRSFSLLLSTINGFLTALRSLGWYANEEDKIWSYHLRSSFRIFTVVDSFLPTFWRWHGMNGVDQHFRYDLRLTKEILLMTGPLLLAV